MRTLSRLCSSDTGLERVVRSVLRFRLNQRTSLMNPPSTLPHLLFSTCQRLLLLDNFLHLTRIPRALLDLCLHVSLHSHCRSSDRGAPTLVWRITLPVDTEFCLQGVVPSLFLSSERQMVVLQGSKYTHPALANSYTFGDEGGEGSRLWFLDPKHRETAGVY